MKILGGKYLATAVAASLAMGAWIAFTHSRNEAEARFELAPWQEDENARKKDTFRIATLVPILSLEPGGISPFEFSSMVYDVLAISRCVDAVNCFRCNMTAMDYQISPDGKEALIKIRKGMRFHDGSEVTAGDVAYSLDAVRSENSMTFQPGAKYTALDRYTVQGKSEKWANWNLSLAKSVFSKDHETKFDKKMEGYLPIGSGPYKFVSYDSNKKIIKLERWDEYWAGPAPYKYMEIHSFDSPDAQTMALLEGSVDYCVYGNNEDINLIKTNKNILIDEMQGEFTGMLVLNAESPKFKDWRVRKALSLLIPREHIVNSPAGLRGSGVATDTIMNEVFPPNQPKVEDGYNPELAAKLLAQAGYRMVNGSMTKGGEPLKITIMLQQSDFMNTLGSMRILAKAWNDAGITCSLRGERLSEIVNMLEKRSFDAYLDLKILPLSVQQYGIAYINCQDAFVSGTCDENLARAYEQLFSAVVGKAPQVQLLTLKQKVQARFRQISHVLPLFRTKCYVALRGTHEEARRVRLDPYSLRYISRPRLEKYEINFR